jgi:DNA-binding beta-propeller fold protein YncE
MTRGILLAAGLAYLVYGVLAGAADDASSKGILRPSQIWWSGDENSLIVGESATGRFVEIDARTGKLAKVANGGARIRGFAAPAPNQKLWASIEPGVPAVRIFEGDFLKSRGIETDRGATKVIAIADNPEALVFTPDSKIVLVACDMPGPADRRLCQVDVEAGSVSDRSIRGSSNLRGVAVDPHGRFALAVHLVHKSHLPSTQIEQGWVFTNAITYLSLEGPPVTVTLPLDLRTQGFANPEGVAITPDGLKAYVAHAGGDLVSVIDLPALLDIVAASQQMAGTAGGQTASGSYTHDDLRLTRRYVQRRIPVGAGPRGISVSPDGKWVAVANRLDGSLSLIDTAIDSVVATLSLAAPGEPAPLASDALVHEGEKLFHSGGLSFSGQFSCASCHPDGRADGLNWDLPADGFNNFHNTKSLLSIDGTAPYGWLGTSPTLRDRFTGTLRHLFQHEPTEREAAALEAYLSRLKAPEPVAPTALTQSAVARGRALFDGKAGCRGCHAGPKFTDRSLHDVGTGADGQAEFDTPALIGIATTPPYLHDGRAATLEEIFVRQNPSGLHGQAADLAPAELTDLIGFLKSL